MDSVWVLFKDDGKVYLGVFEGPPTPYELENQLSVKFEECWFDKATGLEWFKTDFGTLYFCYEDEVR
jgi:hypothetical protein